MCSERHCRYCISFYPECLLVFLILVLFVCHMTIFLNWPETSSSVKPRKGDALLFFNLKPDGTTDSVSLHGGCPVIKGEKWSATKWIRVSSFDKVHHPQGNCTDENESCTKWAALGECIKNPEYMVGTTALPGYCRRSCNVC